MAHDREARTEQATPKRRSKAREAGQIATSREITAVVVLLCSGGTLYYIAESAGLRLIEAYKLIFGRLDELMVMGPDRWLAPVGIAAGGLVLPVALAGATGALVSGFGQSGGLFSSRALRPQLNRINPLPKLKQIFFSKEALRGLVVSFAKLAVVGGLTAQLVWQELPQLLELGQLSLVESLSFLLGSMVRLTVRVAALFAVFAIIDYLMTRRKFENEMKMSKEEVKYERRDQEGDPKIKAKRRAKQRELAMARMMSDVSKADVVVVNPTHYAVALRYEMEEMAAPKVVAKGKDQLAARIRERARENGIPVIHNPPLTRGLYAQVKVGEDIPLAFFSAVAEVLAFVYRTVGRRRVGLGEVRL
jgi:flagellar biosynthetic protein FlhB